jgi:hypothetical protein
MLILSGREPFFEEITTKFKDTGCFFWEIKLSKFNFEETKEAIQKPMIAHRITFTEEVIQKIHSITDGHPCFVQFFAYNLFDLRKSATIDLATFEQNKNLIFDALGKRFFDLKLNTLSQKEKEVISKLALIETEIFTNSEAQNLLHLRGLNQYLKNLSRPEVGLLVKVRRGSYKFYHPLFKDYLKSKQDLL